MNELNTQVIAYAKRYEGTPAPMTAMGELTYWRTYSRNLWEYGRKEHWNETVARVVMGCFDILRFHVESSTSKPWDESRSIKSAIEMYDRIYHFKFTPPGRGLYAMGTPALKHGGAVLNNCAFVSTGRGPFWEAMGKLMNLTMLGVGVGYDTLGAGTFTIKARSAQPIYFIIPDTREGWVEALELLLKTHLTGGTAVRFIYDKVRPAGVPIKGFGGVSSGPEPLRRMLEAIDRLCNSYVGMTVDSAFIVDCANYVGRCVVAGNVRRSAQIAIGLPNDSTFLHLKEDFEAVKDRRAFSNNSVRASVGMDYSEAAELTARTGEPGYFWLDNARMYGRMNGVLPTRTDFLAMGTNPCSEQTLEDGELCCLVETYPSHHTDLNDYLKTLKIAYLYAKAVTLLETGFTDTDAIIRRNRRIGCSMSGVTQAIQKLGAHEFMRWCNRGYDFLTGLDASYSAWLDVPESIKRTSIKPSGTVSLLANVTPGIHFAHSEYYIRRIRLQANSPVLPVLEAAGYTVVPDVYGQEKGKENTFVVEFPIKEPYFNKGKAQAGMWEQLELTAALQKNWADNQVSVTIHFKPEEAKDIPLALEMYQYRLKSVSFLPYNPSEVYPLAPYEEITAETYGKLSERIKPVVLPYGVNDAVEQPKGCDSDQCSLT